MDGSSTRAPLVREVTFENAEALTEENVPLLILFRKMEDTKSVERFKAALGRELSGDRARLNFLTADGAKFQHPLRVSAG